MTRSCSVCSTPCTLSCSCNMKHYCSQDCQRADWDQHKLSCPKVEEREVSKEKGRGLFATRDIKTGKLVLEESPLILVHRNKNVEKEVQEEYQKLPKKQKRAYSSLHYHNLTWRKKILNIWSSNALSTLVCKSDQAMEGLYYRVARINHSCRPNCVINFTPDQKVRLIAVADIKKGEEVLLSYLRPTEGITEELFRHDRRKILRTRFQFSCECQTCSLTGQKLQRNEELKSELSGLLSTLTKHRNLANLDNVQKSVLLQLQIIKNIKALGPELIRKVTLSSFIV